MYLMCSNQMVERDTQLGAKQPPIVQNIVAAIIRKISQIQRSILSDAHSTRTGRAKVAYLIVETVEIGICEELYRHVRSELDGFFGDVGHAFEVGQQLSLFVCDVDVAGAQLIATGNLLCFGNNRTFGAFGKKRHGGVDG